MPGKIYFHELEGGVSKVKSWNKFYFRPTIHDFLEQESRHIFGFCPVKFLTLREIYSRDKEVLAILLVISIRVPIFYKL